MSSLVDKTVEGKQYRYTLTHSDTPNFSWKKEGKIFHVQYSHCHVDFENILKSLPAASHRQLADLRAQLKNCILFISTNNLHSNPKDKFPLDAHAPLVWAKFDDEYLLLMVEEQGKKLIHTHP